MASCRPTEVCNLIAAVADVLATVHPLGIVHRDLKPDNILFAEADSGFPLRVIDWGVARLGRDGQADPRRCDAAARRSTCLPSRRPGQTSRAPCDIYSLGVIAYEALTGQPPFDGRTLAEVVART